MGSVIKAEMVRQGRTSTWLASQVHCTPENLYKLFNRQWVTMPMLFKISAALNHDFFQDCSEYLKQKGTN